MRLKKIRLSGFKSFVDPITIPVMGNLTGIVGPNGCGKSNIIDAVRWVMGESSAKQLRGDSMADVIFNGSTSRKPVGRAMVELVFDNTEGKLPGQYAQYAEIAIRREAERDGLSDYFLNKTRCRRKDIIDLFLGTGAGAHAYSIIEQNAVNRIVESKPEELRAMFEEAAGVSRYRERRRETENRIKHTRENLSRVEDILREMETTISRLQRQARTAARYKELKQEERQVEAELTALRWRGLDQALQVQHARVSQFETAFEESVAGLRSVEAEEESLRVRQIEAQDAFHVVQADFYSVGSEITQTEQALRHAESAHTQRQHELQELTRHHAEAERLLGLDRVLMEQLASEASVALSHIDTARTQQAEARTAAGLAEEAARSAQSVWETFSQEDVELRRTLELSTHAEAGMRRQIDQWQARIDRLAQELAQVEQSIVNVDLAVLRQALADAEREHDQGEQACAETESAIPPARQALLVAQATVQSLSGEIQTLSARLAALEELQSVALNLRDQVAHDWLKQHALSDAQRLATRLKVEAGWEKAVERVLGGRVAAVCVDALEPLAGPLGGLRDANVTVVAPGGLPMASPGGGHRETLLDKITEGAEAAPFLSGFFVTESLEEAMRMRGGLAVHESIVTRSGIWVGPNWISVAGRASQRAGAIERAHELEAIRSQLVALDDRHTDAQRELNRGHQTLAGLETERTLRLQNAQSFSRARASRHAEVAHHEERHRQETVRLERLRQEISEAERECTEARAQLTQTGAAVLQARARLETQEPRRVALSEGRERTRQSWNEARARSGDADAEMHRIEIEQGSRRARMDSTGQAILRLMDQLTQLHARRDETNRQIEQERVPEQALRSGLESLLERKLGVESRLAMARQSGADLEHAVRENQNARHRADEKIESARRQLEQGKLDRQEISVRAEAVAEHLRAAGQEPSALLTTLPEDAEIEGWQTRLTEVTGRIERLGAINLVAIEEFDEQSKRKAHLDSQNADLVQALATLEEAIQKIDRETRTRFRETFEKVNTAFQMMFPRLFGGGHATLELIGDEIMETGVRVMARPPGKRNSTIHLLSGGEKALTAVALLFAIFELNPAPFCFLDEVDAPLDDSNVVRYSEVLKSLALKTQLVYITHNKISMEVAERLVGVTMSEPGVSRLVSVDVEEALRMVESESSATALV